MSIKFKENGKERWECASRKYHDTYGKKIMDFAEKWAELMQDNLKGKAAISDVAEKTAREADTAGITGLMYARAIRVLADSWEYGDELKAWHNKKHGYEGAEIVCPMDYKKAS